MQCVYFRPRPTANPIALAIDNAGDDDKSDRAALVRTCNGPTLLSSLDHCPITCCMVAFRGWSCDRKFWTGQEVKSGVSWR